MVILSVWLLSNPPAAHAATPQNPTAFEISRLPSFCLDTEWFAGPKNSPRQSPRAAAWEQQMGYGFWSLHHYCWGLVSLDRFHASPGTGEARNFKIHQIVSEYYYVLNNSPPDFILRPEILWRLGEAELLRENFGAAYEAFFQARKQKPDYWPAYSAWAEVLIKAKKTADARKLVEEGLTHAPESKVLQGLLKKLGGDPGKFVRNTPTPAPQVNTTSQPSGATVSADSSAQPSSTPGPAEAASAASGRP